MDNLFCGNLFPPLFSGGQISHWFVQRASLSADVLWKTFRGNAITIPGTADF